MDKITKFPYQFFLITFLFTWILLFPLVLAGAGIIVIEKNWYPFLRWTLLILSGFGPAAGAFYCLRTRNGKGAISKYLCDLLDLRFGWKVWIIPIFVLGFSFIIPWILPEFWGEPRLAMMFSSFWYFPFCLLLMIFVGGGEEELGWRGYILDHMEDRFGPWFGNLILGLIWSIWHLPLFFIPETTQSYEPFIAFMVQCIGLGGILSWVHHSSGKHTMASIYVHGLSNAITPFFPTIIFKPNVPQTRLWIWAGLTFVIGFVMLSLRVQNKNRVALKNKVV